MRKPQHAGLYGLAGLPEIIQTDTASIPIARNPGTGRQQREPRVLLGLLPLALPLAPHPLPRR